MGPCVGADRVALPVQLLQKFGILLRHAPDGEECRLHAMFLQRVDHRLRVRPKRPIVEGQDDLMIAEVQSPALGLVRSVVESRSVDRTMHRVRPPRSSKGGTVLDRRRSPPLHRAPRTRPLRGIKAQERSSSWDTHLRKRSSTIYLKLASLEGQTTALDRINFRLLIRGDS